MGGGNPAPTSVEYYDGTSWTEGADISNARRLMGAAADVNTAGLIWGGAPAPPGSAEANTEQYDGTTWSEVNNLSRARYKNGGAGTSVSAICIGDTNSPYQACEEWTQSQNIKTIAD